MKTDADLLRDYAMEASQPAFQALVERHLDLVYSAALRQLNGDQHLARDATQTVFVDLARKAPALANRPALVGWLYTSACFAANKLVRTERRRIAREQEASLMHDLTRDDAPAPNWERLRPLLDRAML